MTYADRADKGMINRTRTLTRAEVSELNRVRSLSFLSGGPKRMGGHGETITTKGILKQCIGGAMKRRDLRVWTADGR
jgi:hypothetical protein